MIEKCKYCGFYSNNINDNSLRDGYCFLEDVGNYCKRNENDYCSKFVFAGCKSCINNRENGVKIYGSYATKKKLN